MNTTSCETCDHVVTATRTKSPHSWMCIRFPRVEGLDAVAPTQRVVMEPYMRCVGINGGYCPLWTVRREGQMDLGVGK